MALPEEEDLGPFRAARRAHVADEVFDQIAAAILRGELAVGSALPPERVLADRFQTSRIIARQALHRLAELGLVRVRQGGVTLVLDPKESGDLRILELLYRLTPPTDREALASRHALEKQVLQGLCLVEVATRCARQEALDEIDALARAFAGQRADEALYAAFEERFWRAVAAAGENSVFIMEVAWWYRVFVQHPRMAAFVPSPLATRVAFYRELARRMAKGESAVACYLEAATPLLAALRARGPSRRKPARRKASPRSSR